MSGRLAQTEAKVLTCEEISWKVSSGFENVLQTALRLDLEKCNLKMFNEFKASQEKRSNFIETHFETLMNKNKSLENWMDIYMPLRMQH